MKINNIEIPIDKIKAFCTDWQVTEFALFGSVLRDYFFLLAWGFGAEANREAIAKAVEGWGLAGLDRE